MHGCGYLSSREARGDQNKITGHPIAKHIDLTKDLLRTDQCAGGGVGSSEQAGTWNGALCQKNQKTAWICGDSIRQQTLSPRPDAAQNCSAQLQNVPVCSSPACIWLVFPSPPKPTQSLYLFPAWSSWPSPWPCTPPCIQSTINAPLPGPGPMTLILLSLEASFSCPSQSNNLFLFHRVLWLEPHLARQGLAWLCLLGCAFQKFWVWNTGCLWILEHRDMYHGSDILSSLISPKGRTLNIYIHVQTQTWSLSLAFRVIPHLILTGNVNMFWKKKSQDLAEEFSLQCFQGRTKACTFWRNNSRVEWAYWSELPITCTLGIQ